MKRSSKPSVAAPEAVPATLALPNAPAAIKRRTVAVKTPDAGTSASGRRAATKAGVATVSEPSPAAPVAPLDDIGDGGPSELPRRATAAVPADATTREERIRALAFQRYLERNGLPGDATSDWLEAEAQLSLKAP